MRPTTLGCCYFPPCWDELLGDVKAVAAVDQSRNWIVALVAFVPSFARSRPFVVGHLLTMVEKASCCRRRGHNIGLRLQILMTNAHASDPWSLTEYARIHLVPKHLSMSPVLLEMANLAQDSYRAVMT